MTGLSMIKPDIVASGNTWVDAGGEAVVDGNIVLYPVDPITTCGCDRSCLC